MPKLSKRVPKYRRHSARNKAFIVIGGKRHSLPGKYGSDESKQAYNRKLLELAASVSLPAIATDPAGLTVCELLVAYKRWAKTYYRDSQEYSLICYTLRPLKELYAETLVSEFGPKSLKAVRQSMIDSNLCRNEINKRIGRIKRVFKWGVQEELVSPIVLQALQAVQGLSYGRTDARESEPVKPVADADVDAIKAFVTPQVWAMIELQRHTGARPGEIASMRTSDVDTTGEVWTYTPRRHKTQYRGHARRIFLGPKAREILRPWLRKNPDEPLFQPCEAVAWIHARRAANRKTPKSAGNVPGSNRKRSPKRVPGDVYSTGRYGNAIRRACKAAKIPEWHPHQLRHTAATMIRRQFGIEAAQVVLGHSRADVTQIYAERNHKLGRQVATAIG